MSDDIVDRLRNPMLIHSHASVAATTELDSEQAIQDMKDAAAEIERLREVSAQRKNKKEVVVTSRNRIAEGMEFWKGEAERLRAALVDIRIMAGREGPPSDLEALNHIEYRAKQALKSPKP